MKFAHPLWLSGLALSVLVAVALIWGGAQALRSLQRFGERPVVANLLTHRVGQRRTIKGTVLVLAVAFAFVSLAGPQYGRGTRLLPATNLDVVIVLDYSKSMYARDITPSRIDRAKVEVARLVRELAGARFGAVAFAGEPISFPITSDGGAIAQFFRQLEPNDMPVGGTAIARALEAARSLLKRDPKSSSHQKVILLVTDGEDLEGDPVAIARSAAEDRVVIHVVQIGGRTPEPIPQINEDGTFAGPRTDSNGAVLTTQLSSEGETQLSEVAKAANGFVVRSEQGDTGLPEVTKAMKRLMTEELSERVETVYADIFHYPLIVCLLLLLLDSLIVEAPRLPKRPIVPNPRGALKSSTAGLLLLLLMTLPWGCARLEEKLFTRHSPTVDDAITKLKSGDSDAALGLLQSYLQTGECTAGQIATPPSVREKPAAGFDLGLALFAVAERFGQRFGEGGLTQGAPINPNHEADLARRSQEVDCALQIVRVIAADTSLPPVLRAQAYFLSANLEFLRGDYKSAVSGYDSCLRLVPGDPSDAGLSLGDHAAYNRAIALRRWQEEEEDKNPPDAGTPEQNRDAGGNDQNQGGAPNQDEQQEPDDQQQQDQKEPEQSPDRNQGGAPNQEQEPEGAGGQGGSPPQPESQEQQAQREPSPSLSQDERMLDLLEEAPTVQHHQASEAQRKGRVIRGMEDK